MTANPTSRALSLAAVAATVAMLISAAGAPGAQAAEAPVKQVLSAHIGWEVNDTTHGNTCTVESKNRCQPGTQSSEPGGFADPASVAGAPDGNVYVAEVGNSRIQELTPNGEFVLMFGEDVNETTGGNVCTEAEIETAHVKCKAGREGVAPGQFGGQIQSIAVDSGSGNVYVAEITPGLGDRVQAFTANGQFVLEIGRNVNEKTKGNLCTQEEVEKEGVKCTSPGLGSEPGAFDFQSSGGDMLAIGGPEDLLYVGDEHRVQEFSTSTGMYVGEIPLTSISSKPNSDVSALAVDKTGDVYLVYHIKEGDRVLSEALNVIREFSPAGMEITRFELTPRETNATEIEPIIIQAIALDPAGRLAVTESELGVTEDIHSFAVSRGSLYEVGTTSLHLITEFTYEFSFLNLGLVFTVAGHDITFNSKGELYVVAGYEVIAYLPLPVGGLLTSPATCQVGTESQTDATLDCALNGEVDLWGVRETQVSFQWGRTLSFGEKTKSQPIANVKSAGEEEPLVKVSASIEGLRPNEAVNYRLSGEDENVKAPELLTGATVSFDTPVVAPRIVGEPSTSHAGFSTAVLFAELNPENASTAYEFQYGPCENLASCPGALETPGVESSTYGAIGTTVETSGLQPDTTYRFRLLANNERQVNGMTEGGEATGSVGSFTTAPAPVVQAATDAASAVTSAGAVLAGTVNPDGQAAAYTFELGVYNGANTQFGIVFSGPAGAGTTPVEKTLALAGLQPGTEYAYRIAAHSGDGSAAGEAAAGATLTFTTQGLPSLLVSPTPLAMLAVPAIAFPEPAAATVVKTTTKRLTNAQKLAKALTACKRTSEQQRAACEKQARSKYAKSKQANDRKKG